MCEAIHDYTIDQYQALIETETERKFEYVHGTIRLMSGGSRAHSKIGVVGWHGLVGLTGQIVMKFQ